MSDNIQFDFNDINFTKPEAPKNENSSGVQFFDFTEVSKEEKETPSNYDLTEQDQLEEIKDDNN